jgi:hypothetical protein
VGAPGGDRPMSFTSEAEAELWCGNVSFDCFVWDSFFLGVFSPPLSSPLLTVGFKSFAGGGFYGGNVDVWRSRAWGVSCCC